MKLFLNDKITFENFHLHILFHAENEWYEGIGMRYLIREGVGNKAGRATF